MRIEFTDSYEDETGRGIEWAFNEGDLLLDIPEQLEDLIILKQLGKKTMSFKELNKLIDEWVSHAQIYVNRYNENNVIWDTQNNFNSKYMNFIINISDMEYDGKVKYWIMRDEWIFYIHSVGINAITPEGKKKKVYKYNASMYRIEKMFKVSNITMTKLNMLNKTDFLETEIEKLSKLKDTVEIL